MGYKKNEAALRDSFATWTTEIRERPRVIKLKTAFGLCADTEEFWQTEEGFSAALDLNLLSIVSWIACGLQLLSCIVNFVYKLWAIASLQLTAAIIVPIFAWASMRWGRRWMIFTTFVLFVTTMIMNIGMLGLAIVWFVVSLFQSEEKIRAKFDTEKHHWIMGVACMVLFQVLAVWFWGVGTTFSHKVFSLMSSLEKGATASDESALSVSVCGSIAAEGDDP